MKVLERAAVMNASADLRGCCCAQPLSWRKHLFSTVVVSFDRLVLGEDDAGHTVINPLCVSILLF